MKSFKSMLSLVALLVAGVTANAQTADDIVNKHIDAVGGKDKLAGITSMVTEVTASSQMGDASATATVLVGKGYKNEMDMGGQKMVQVITDKSGWAINPFGGSTDPQPMPDDQYKASVGQLYVDPLLDYAAHGAKVELQGLDGNDYKLLFTSKDGVATTYYINKDTYLFDKLSRNMNMMGQDLELTMTFSDYKKTDYGTMAAYTTEMAYGSMFSMTMTTKKITVNGQVSPTIFDMPK